MFNRRQFLQRTSTAALGACAATPLAAFSNPLRPARMQPVGVQLYTLLRPLQEDFTGTLETIAEIGYRELEFAGPYAFSAQSVKDGWQAMADQMSLTDSGYYSHTPAEVKTLLDDLGLTAPSAHIALGTVEENLDGAIEAAQVVGHRYLVCPFLAPESRQSLDDYKRLADTFNAAGERCREAEIQFAYHNHCFEFGEIDGQLPYDVLLDATEPDLVQMELDLFWITVAGLDPVDYFERYPGRFSLFHLKDMAAPMTLENEERLTLFENPPRLMEVIGNLADVGQGVIDFPRLLAHAEEAGLQHAFVERDMAEDPLASIRTSYPYVEKLDV